MTVEPSVGLFVALGAPPTGPNFGTLFPGGFATDANARKEKLREVRDLLARARLYGKAVDAAKTGAAAAPVADPRMAALRPVLDGKRPVIMQANTRAEILDALKFAEAEKVRLIVAGGKESWKVAEALAERKVPVLLGPVLDLPNNYEEPFDSLYACAARLHAAGVRFCFQTAGAANVRNLPYEAAFSVAHGLPAHEALKAVTAYPAEILGVSDRLGTVTVGKSADLIITTGDPLQVTTDVVGVFIAGKPVELSSKQTRLYDRYLGRIRSAKKPAENAGAPAAEK
jgi:imidazolonepropionase-like amidohydrolase